jgi:hypothetical protein
LLATGRFFFLLLLFFVSQLISAQQYLPSNCRHPEFPKVADNQTVTIHTGYALVYNEKHEQASWVAYILTKKETQGTEEREDRFIEDLYISTGSIKFVDPGNGTVVGTLSSNAGGDFKIAGEISGSTINGFNQSFVILPTPQALVINTL